MLFITHAQIFALQQQLDQVTKGFWLTQRRFIAYISFDELCYVVALFVHRFVRKCKTFKQSV